MLILKLNNFVQPNTTIIIFLGAQAPLGLAPVKKKKLNEKVSEYQSLALSCKLSQECIKVCKYASITARNGHLYIQGMVTHQPKDGHPTKGCILQTRNLALRLN